MSKFLISLLTFVLLLSGCAAEDTGGAAAPSGLRPAVKTFTARGEADRLAALYRVARDTGSILMPYVLNEATLKAFDGVTTPCLNGGSVSRSYFPGRAQGVEQRMDITFVQCLETLGLIDGTVSIVWSRGDDHPPTGRFAPQFIGIVTVDGATYNYANLSAVSTTLNPNSGLQVSTVTVRTLSGLQGPTGPAVRMQTARMVYTYTLGAPTLTLGNYSVRIVNDRGPGMDFSGSAPLSVDVVPSSAAILGIANVRDGGFRYGRSNRSANQEIILADVITREGLLNIEVKGGATQLTDAGQFDWPTIIDTQNYDPDGE